MVQDYLFKTIPNDKFDLLTKEEVITLFEGEEKLRKKFQKEVERLQAMLNLNEQKSLFIEEQCVLLKKKIFGSSSEKEPRLGEGKTRGNKKGSKRIQLPSQRYPNIPIIEEELELQEVPQCPCCGEQMQDSKMTEDSEYLSVIPAKYVVIRQKRKKYKCVKCQGGLKTTPCPPRIVPGSSYGDDMILDVSLGKYCDLIPIERYAAIAGRSGLVDLPPQSLINLTHYLADFVEGAAIKCTEEVLNSKVIKGDETPHKMLEGDKKKNWLLWGFSSNRSCFFDIRDTRSGDVASEVLKASKCEYFMSDVYSGYGKAVKNSNAYRLENDLKKIIQIYCNAHARRKFKDASVKWEIETKFFIWCYKKIYRLESLIKDSDEKEFNKLRLWQKGYFKLMEKKIITTKANYPPKSTLVKAMKYLFNHFKELTLFLNYKDLPIDNNLQESLFRSPVVGRKTWYGTHSKKGAKTASILMTLVECCKLNKVNPRKYFEDLVKDIHAGISPNTPYEYLKNTAK